MANDNNDYFFRPIDEAFEKRDARRAGQPAARAPRAASAAPRPSRAPAEGRAARAAGPEREPARAAQVYGARAAGSLPARDPYPGREQSGGEINWDDYNFNFDDVYPDAPGAAPAAAPARPQPRDEQPEFSVENMRRLHESGSAAPGASPARRPVRPAPGAAPARRPARPAPRARAAAPAGKTRPRRRVGFFGVLVRLLAALLAVLVLCTAGILLLAKMPETDRPAGVRKDGVCTVLLCGTDAEGTRTDTMMLLYIDRPGKQLRLLSLPRDTMVNRTSAVPKLNGAYGANGAGEEGMDVLMGYVEDLVGYRPDGYMLINLDCFVDLVNLMGGVRYDVPMDMYYNDPSQDLFIDLKAGSQKLNGQEAMWLVRYRSGYTMADLDRIQVQRDFLGQAMKQWATPWKLYKAPFALALVMRNTTTDLSWRNLSWIMKAVAHCGTDRLESDTLPGEPTTVNGGSYYVEWRQAAAELITEKYNPYEGEITADDLHPYGY